MEEPPERFVHEQETRTQATRHSGLGTCAWRGDLQDLALANSPTC